MFVSLCIFFLLSFFFQAEDGIRDAQESRGLGDVYKRQDHGHAESSPEHRQREAAETAGSGHRIDREGCIVIDWGAFLLVAVVSLVGAVSYTHLTLPTIYSV